MKNPSETFDENPEAKKEQLRQHILERFTEFRSYLNELPPYCLLPGHPNYHHYKCRMGFFVAVRNDIWRLIKDGVITDPAAIEEGNKFIEYTKTGHPLEKTSPLGSEFTTQADIDYVNRILDTFLTALSR